MLVFDAETNGFLAELDRFHVLSVKDTETGLRRRFDLETVQSIEGLIEDLMEAPVIGGHNVIKFDIPAIKKIYPWFQPKGVIRDSMVEARVIWPELKQTDFARVRGGRLPSDFQRQGLVGSHSLKAWGYRLGEHKGDYAGGFDEWSPAMSAYCDQDVETTAVLFEKIDSKKYSEECLTLERHVATIVARQERHGFVFNIKAAEELLAILMARRAEMGDECAGLFPPWYAPRFAKGTAEFTPKGNNKPRGYTKGVTFSRVEEVVFNPNSTAHIADRLMTLYGWKPTEYTPSGQVKVDETTLAGLTYPPAKMLRQYLMVQKRIGQLAEGKRAWLKHVEDDGRIHGGVNTNGAVTGRMTHMYPNIAQVPKNESPYGKECRSLFTVPKDRVLVGCDAEGLELRCLAHYMARYDGGSYAETVVNGKKRNKTDVHSVTQRLVEFNSRDHAKTLMYAYLYGAGNMKLGSLVLEDFDEEKRDRWLAKFPAGRIRTSALVRLGQSRRTKLEKGLPALGKLVEAVRKKGNILRGLDGRRLHVRSQHSALNTLLQSAGAIVMKKALVLADDELIIQLDGGDYEYVANVHDETQTEAKPEHAETVGTISADAIRLAGEHFNFRCPLAGDYQIGRTWAETH